MNLKYTKIQIVAVASLVLVMFLCLGIFLTMSYTYSQDNIIITNDKGVTVYVSGLSVERHDDSYYADPGSTVTVTVVNEGDIFQSMNISGTEYYSPIQEITVPETGLEISVNTVSPQAQDKGRYFGNPYLIGTAEDILALSKILSVSDGTEEHYNVFGLTQNSENRTKLQKGYFRLTANITISDDSFFGIGQRGVAFQGCFDFNGKYIYLNVNKTDFSETDFANVNGTMFGDIGLFSVIYGNGTDPCLVRNADVRGTIAIKTEPSEENWIKDHPFTISVGGIAGTSGKDVIVDGMSSQVSISAQVSKATLHLGGIFGFSSTDVESWSHVSYSGLYGNISAITYGEDANAYVGGFCGVQDNAYINSFQSSARSTTFLAQSFGTSTEVSGNAFAGGLAGIVYVGTPSSGRPEISDAGNISIQNIRLNIIDEFIISAVIDNSAGQRKNINSDDFSLGSAGAVTGGLVGTIYAPDNEYVLLSNVVFVGNTSNNMQITSQTLDGDSSGVVYSGGLVGYVHTGSHSHVVYKPSSQVVDENNTVYVFQCSVNVDATQNGAGPAYAGGLFGYNAFTLRSDGDDRRYYFRLSDNGDNFDVSAVQTSLSRSADMSSQSLYPVYAGFYSSKLPSGYNLSDVTVEVQSGSVTARREAGSTAIGDVAAGGIAGVYDGASTGYFKNVDAIFSDAVSINALGYSFDSQYNAEGNNVYAGGMVGHLQNFSGGNSVVENVNIDFTDTVSSVAGNIIVQGVQNAQSGNADYWSEGYVGGVFGMFEDSVVSKTGSGVTFEGNKTNKTLIRFFSSNNPNTASAGGAVGAARSKNRYYDLSNVRVYDAHVVGRAYFDGQQPTDNGSPYDLFVGGAVGVLGNSAVRNNYVSEIYVYDSIVEAVGEQNMMTYAGGLFGGIWWNSTVYVNNGFSVNNSVTASSVTYKAFAGGLTGLVQRSVLDGCGSVNTTVHAKSNTNLAYAAGAVGHLRNDVTLNSNYTSASVSSEGVSGSVSAGFIAYSDPNTSPTVRSINHYVATKANNEWYNSSVVLPIAIKVGASGDSSWLTDKLYLSGGSSDYIFPNLPTVSNAEIQVGTNGVVTFDSASRRITAITNVNGEAFAVVKVKIDGKYYNLCVATIIVGGGGTSSQSVSITNQFGEIVSEANSTAYAVDGRWHYVKIHVGAGNTQTLDITPELSIFNNYVKTYDLTGIANSGSDAADVLSQYREAYSSWTARDASYFNGKMYINFNGSDVEPVSVNVVPSTILRQRCVVAFEVDGNYVIVELVPNRVNSVEVQASPDTPAMGGDGSLENPFIFEKDDTARFDAVINYENPFLAYLVEVEFSGGQAVDGSSAALQVHKNGTVRIKGNGVHGTLYSVNCSIIDGTPLVDGGKGSCTFYILVTTKIDLQLSLSGAIVDPEKTDRLAVSTSKYQLTVIPQPGYGLAPRFNVNGISFRLDQLADGKYSVIFEADGVSYTVEYTVTNGTYTMILPLEYMQTLVGTGLIIEIEFPKVYTILFANEKSMVDGQRYFTVTVEAGKTLHELYDSGYFDEFFKWQETLSLFGYNKAGFYLSDDADSLYLYGQSFDEMLESGGSMVINGAVTFYLRWQFTLTVNLPQNVTIGSALPNSLLDENGILPINDKKGFGFEIFTTALWVGEPRFDFFILDSNGIYNNVTSLFAEGTRVNTYIISDTDLTRVTDLYQSGKLVLYVYSDSVQFAVGDDMQGGVGNEIYSDGIFTVTYNVNYGSADVQRNEVVFRFDVNLPQGTLLALYYISDGVPTWGGMSEITQATDTVNVLQFNPFGSQTLSEVRNAQSSEVFHLVVTLPDNVNNFSLVSASQYSVEVSRYDYRPAVTDYLAEIPGDSGIEPSLSDNKATFVVHPAVVHSVTVSQSNLVYSVEGSFAAGVTDTRHSNVYYLFEISKTDGAAIGSVQFAQFGEVVLSTTKAVYYLASVGNVSLSGLEGYTVRLISTPTSQYPAGGTVLFEQSF